MTLAFVTAYTAGRRTSFDRGAKHAGINGGLTRRDSPGRGADVAAVETEAYAADQGLNVRLGQVRIRTDRAAISTVRALGDAPSEYRSIQARRLWVRLDDLSNGHVCSSLALPAIVVTRRRPAPLHRLVERGERNACTSGHGAHGGRARGAPLVTGVARQVGDGSPNAWSPRHICVTAMSRVGGSPSTPARSGGGFPGSRLRPDE
jgi:hypothetical protein